jgi:hypothetical protein
MMMTETDMGFMSLISIAHSLLSIGKMVEQVPCRLIV